jgi:hypothetical protein
MGGAGIEPASPLGRRAPNWATRRRGRAARVSVQPPGRELDAHASRSGRALVTHWIAGAVANDVVYAARLPFDPGSPAWGAVSYVEGWWSPVLTECHSKSTGECNTYLHMRIQRHIVEDLSLSGGASSGVRTFQAEHHLLIGSGLICLQKQRRRPIGSLLPPVVSTQELASTPRGKGESAAVLALQIGAMPARVDRRRRRRFGNELGCMAEV